MIRSWFRQAHLHSLFERVMRKFFGMRISYAQCGEDLILEHILPSYEGGVYVDIGANSARHFSNTYLLYMRGWQGILVEPQPRLAAQIRRIRPRDTVVPVGVGKHNTTMDFYLFEPHTLSTFDSVVRDKYLAMGHTLRATQRVPVLKLTDILERYTEGRVVDVLSIDTEGSDLDILKSNDWTRFRPTYIVVETLEYKRESPGRHIKEIGEFLQSQGYAQKAHTYINSIYVDTQKD